MNDEKAVFVAKIMARLKKKKREKQRKMAEVSCGYYKERSMVYERKKHQQRIQRKG